MEGSILLPHDQIREAPPGLSSYAGRTYSFYRVEGFTSEGRVSPVARECTWPVLSPILPL